MNQSEMITQKLQWIVERQRSMSQQRRHDLIVDAAFLALMFVIGVVLFLIALS